MHAARDALAGRGVVVSAIADMGGALDAYFSDPDGSSWSLQEIRSGARHQGA
jgi:hypothetical protein